MSWEPAWTSDGRGGFVRNPNRPEEEAEEAPPAPVGGDDEEEGEISAGGVGGAHRNDSFRPRFGGGRGPGNNSNRPPFSGGRHRHHGSFSGSVGSGGPQPAGGSNNAGPPPFLKREGSFGGRGGGFRSDPPPFHEGPRDFRGDGPQPGARDFGPRGDFRGNSGSGDLPPFRPDEPQSNFRDRGPEPSRDFPPREPPFGGPSPSQRPPFRDGPPFRPGIERGRVAGVPAAFGGGRPPEVSREGSFGALPGGPPVRDGSFGPRDIGGPPRDIGRDGSFGPRSGDSGGPPRDLVRDGSFGPRGGDMGGPPREPSRDGSFGPRGGEIGGPPPPPQRDIGREGSFGPRGGDIGGPPRDPGRDGSFGPRQGDMAVSPREPGRDGSFGPRGGDLGGPPRDPLRVVSAPFPRGGPPLPRDGGPLPHPFHRGDSPRETAFGDLAGPPPPRDRPFRDEPRGRVGSQGPPGPSQGVPMANIPSDPRRPTDPRRRSSQDLGGLAPVVPPHVPSDAPSDGPPIPSPQPGRRLGSYSSLADSSTIPPNLMPAQPTTGHDAGPGGFRSPAGRRPLMDPARHERGTEHYGSGAPQRASWSPAPERRAMSGSPRPPGPPIKSPGFSTSAQGGTSTGSGVPPLAPSLSSSSRGPQPPNFRDPRFKGNDKPGDARPDVNPSAPVGSLAGHIPKKIATEGPDSSSLPTDAFGRARMDFGDRSSFQKSPRSSPTKATAIKTFPTSPRNDQVQTTLERRPSGSISGPPSVPPAEPSVPPKAPPSPPLLTSVLGEGEIVQRAETAVLHLSEMIGNKNLKAEGDGLSELPAKQMIMSAVNEIEKLIKEAQKELESCEESKKEALKTEAEEVELEKKRLAEETTRRLEGERLRQEEERRLEEQLKAEGLKKALEESHDDLSQARKTLEVECEQMIHRAREDHMRQHAEERDVQISNAEEGFDKDIAKARNSVEKARSSVTRVESKLAAAQSEYESLLESVQGGNTMQKKESKGTSGSAGISSLVEQIMAENNRTAREAHALGFSMASENDQPSVDERTTEESGGSKDPQLGKSCEEWSVLTKQVTGLSDALYSEPSEAPYYQQHERTHVLLAPIVKEYIRDQKKRLVDEWTVLAEEYEVRKRLYEKQQRKLAKKAQRGSVSVSRKSILAGDKESTGVGQGIDRGNILESGSRTSNNPYRRARRGNEVRSEYEQEQIIAEIAAKEAMEKRITHGGSKIPRQISRLERGLTASYANTFTSYKIDDPLKEAEESQMNNVWTDMEKCIFLDRFLQFPKDFRRIASFLRNKTTKDCIAFYYDSKQTVPYKGALKEHVMRRKRKGDYQIWDASIQAALSVGATVTAGESEEKPVEFSLPRCDKTYRTYMLHPLRRQVLDAMPIDEDVARAYEGESRSEESKWKSRKRGRDPLFSLDKEHTKFLRMASQDSMSGVTRPKITPFDDEILPGDPEPEDAQEDSAPSTPVRKAPQKWTTAEKRIFAETLEQHGRDWAKLAEAVGTKNEKQIKNFYYDWKKGKSRPPSEKKSMKKEKPPKDRSDDSTKETASRLDEDSTEEAEDVRSEKEVDLPTFREHPPDQPDYRPQEYVNQGATLAELRAQAEALAREREAAAAAAAVDAVRHRLEIPENSISGGSEFGGGNHELIQQLLNQQLQQQHSQQPQSALQQLLSQQHIQREQQQQQQLNQLSLEEARRLLEHHQPSRGSVLSNLLSSQWLGPPQLLQGQSGLSSHPLAAALRGEGNNLGAGLADVGDLQRLLHLQQSQGLGMPGRSSHLASLLLGDLGGSSSANNLSSALIQQLANRGSSAGPGADHDHISSLANAQSLMGYGAGGAGANSLASALYRQAGGGGMDSGGVSDALSLLARSMQRGDGNQQHGFGRLHDRSDGSGRYS